MKTLLASSAVAAITLFALPAFADSDRDRVGIVVGGSVDGGNLGCQNKNGDDCGNGAHAAGGLSVHLGGMVGPNIAILGELWGMAHTDDNVTASQVLATANVRGWVVPHLWLQAGVGVAQSRLAFKSGAFMASTNSDTVPAFDLAAGVELIRTPQFGLDVEVRGGSGFYQSDTRVYNTSLGIGVSFF